MKTNEDKLKLALFLLNKADNLLIPLESRGTIDDDIRNYVMEAINKIEQLLEVENDD